MQGDIVKAAKWLGGSIVCSCLICVVGFHPAVTGRTLSIQKVTPDASPVPADVSSHLPPERVHSGLMVAPPAVGRCECAVTAVGPVNVNPMPEPSAIITPPSVCPSKSPVPAGRDLRRGKPGLVPPPGLPLAFAVPPALPAGAFADPQVFDFYMGRGIGQ